MSAVDDIEFGEDRELTPLEDAVDRQWPCCGVCNDFGWLMLPGSGRITCFCMALDPLFLTNAVPFDPLVAGGT